ncbi:MAG TPA: hypothetical protein VMW76_09730 [Bacteroidales bacterium]|nr:hypothetical protein [Bacteroidales bacterium]
MTDQQRIDKVLSKLASSASGRLNVQKILMEDLEDDDQVSYMRIITTMVDMKYVQRLSGAGMSNIVYILTAGQDIVKNGGYLKYLENSEEEKRKDRIRREEEAENTSYTLILNKFYWKYRWLPFVLSILAVLISIFALVCSR